uniref:DNA-directed RNA polymerase subunit alpha n=1 Tax=Ourococcus multisporus TaxID=132186 RepID=A0A140GIY2_9CHLO|nr:alpha subunit of RNA polymerase [Ourococcus multisporus]
MQNFFLSCKEIRIEPTSPRTYYGCFYLGPFENGQGLTVANTLRRTLLSEISGLAITSVKVNDAYHEYSMLPGVRETVLDILLNLKEIILTKKNKKPLIQTQLGYLQVRGPGVVRASDLKLPPMIQCIDPDQYIATLSENGYLNLKFRIDEGKNFIFQKNPFDLSNFHRKGLLVDERFLLIDAVFTPVKKVNYTVESYGAESIEKANQVIILEVWTNGGVSPKEAVSQTLNYLRMLFSGLGQLKVLQSTLTNYSLNNNKKSQQVLKKINNDLDLFQARFFKKRKIKHIVPDLMTQELSKSIKNKRKEEYLEEINQQTIKEWKNKNINDLGLPFRVFNCLYKAKIQTIGEILEMNPTDLKEIPGLGQHSLWVLKETLKLKGLTLKQN